MVLYIKSPDFRISISFLLLLKLALGFFSSLSFCLLSCFFYKENFFSSPNALSDFVKAVQDFALQWVCTGCFIWPSPPLTFVSLALSYVICCFLCAYVCYIFLWYTYLDKFQSTTFFYIIPIKAVPNIFLSISPYTQRVLNKCLLNK